MGAAAGADMGHRRFVRIGLEPGDEVLGVIGRQPGLAKDDERRGAERCHRLEVAQHMPLHRIQRTGADVAGPVADAERVSVGCRRDRAADADRGARAGHVLGDHRLSERPLHVLAEDAGKRVGRAARRERHDDRDGTGRKVLRGCATHGHNGSKHARNQQPEHHVLLEVCLLFCGTLSANFPAVTEKCTGGGPAGTRLADYRCRRAGGS